MENFRDKLWLFGQDAGSHHIQHNLPGQNLMGPTEGASFLGINNCLRVVMDNKPSPPFDNASAELKDMKQVVWSIVGNKCSDRNDGGQNDLDEVIRQSHLFPNISGVLLDDFFIADTGKARINIEDLKKIKYRLQNEAARPLDLWLVLYSTQLDTPVQEYIDLCDVITFWIWDGKDLVDLDENFVKFKAITEGKRRLAGCYMWDYGAEKTLTNEQMESQCHRYLQYLSKNEIEGIIFLSNCIADIGLNAVEWTREWINKKDSEKQC